MIYIFVGTLLVGLGIRIGYAMAHSEVKTWKYRANATYDKYKKQLGDYETLKGHFRGALAKAKLALLSTNQDEAMKAKFDFLHYESEIKLFLKDEKNS